ncbi:hypothetical protein Z043_123614 [Scleropages formosus]|uniref:Amidase domain-containing protein n=1 Tax=Scleropages formosus TaxID=113540 RepID=A0A0P7TCN4_SCLFO|nr:hypothetical protein Z043_123614 [Scleropages formosus]
MPNSAGLLSRRGVVSGTDAPAVALLKKAGAIPLAVTNCSELCMWLESHNHLYGITRNPYDTRRIPGGSSGGEGSILASGGSVVGVGSDIGGSIRMPAFFNGIFGHKPTPECDLFGAVPAQVVRRLEADLGVTVQEVPLPQLRYSHHIWLDCMASPNQHGELPVPFAELMGDGSRKVWPLWELLKWLLGRSPHTLPAIGLALVDKVLGSQPSRFIGQQKEQLQVRVEQLLGSDGVLLYPPHPRVAPEHHVPVFTPFDFSYTGVFNILGLPVTQCPLGLGEQRLPLGVQVVAGKLQDRLCLAVARHLERAFGGWRDPGAP